MKSMFLNVYDLRRSFSFWIIIILVLINGWYGKKLKRWDKNEIINHDVTHYHAYFPATFIYHDWSFEFVKNLPEDFDGRIWLLHTPEGKPVLKMTMGLSMLWLPFETLAHFCAGAFHFKADGYTKPYSLGIFFAALFYLSLGLLFLRNLLLDNFDEITTAITVLTIVLGTNLMHYVVSEPGMPHVYDFSLISIFLYLVPKWLKNPSWHVSIALGFVFGLILLIRPINIVVILIPLLWGIDSIKSFKNRILFFSNNLKMICIILLSIFMVLIPQLIYWKSATGHWVYYSYQNEQFFFFNPHIINGLFSYRKGWLLYTPIMAIAFIGFCFLHKFAKGIRLSLIVTMAFALYITYSWWTWWYGGSFGSRPMIDYYGLMSIPLAAFIQQVVRSKLWLKMLMATIFSLLLFLNQFQMKQYQKALLHWDSMTKPAYWAIMFKKDRPSDYEQLIQTPDYRKAFMGEEEY